MLAAAVMMAMQAAAVGLHGPQASAASAFAGPVSLSRGRTIYLQCSGSGRFTVVLEPGDGGHRQHMAKLSTSFRAVTVFAPTIAGTLVLAPGLPCRGRLRTFQRTSL